MESKRDMARSADALLLPLEEEDDLDGVEVFPDDDDDAFDEEVFEDDEEADDEEVADEELPVWELDADETALDGVDMMSPAKCLVDLDARSPPLVIAPLDASD